MNILSISQVKTQNNQNDLNGVLPIQTSASQKTESGEKSSFADFLRDAQKASEPVKHEESRQSENPATVSAKQEEKPENLSENESKVAKKDEKSSETRKNEKTEKTVSKSDDEKIAEKDENSENFTENLLNDGKFISVSLNQIQNAKKSPDSESESLEIAGIDSENLEINDKSLAWLVAQTRDVDENDEISSEDFAKLIDAAVEFIPGSESEGEKLENAQNLAVSDPKFFLEAAENAQIANDARGAVKSDLALDSDKKIAGAKTEPKEKSGARLSVHDLRTHRLFEDNSAKVDSTKIVQKSAEKKEISLSIQQQNENNLQMTMELASKAQENITSSSAQAAGANGSDFQAMLSNAVQENAPEFVKAGNIVLKDNNQGTINLVLRPEGLGNVKISLNLDDKNLSAQITVHTKEAMEAFRESISSLKQAFTESGFETGSFDLNFSNQNQQGFAQGGNDGQNQQGANILASRTYGDFVSVDALPDDAANAYASEDYSVNIVA